MPATRRSTVWDYSDFRLHPDGRRVSSDPSTSRAPRYAASSVQDSRGNWVARDALGQGTVPPYRIIRTSKDKKKTGGQHPQNRSEDSEAEGQGKCLPSDSQGKGKGKQKENTVDAVSDAECVLETRSTVHQRRAERRKRFREDTSYLVGRNSRTSTGRTPLPTADLLKCIHLFASHHYTVRGQLFDLASEHRRRRSSRKSSSSAPQIETGNGNGNEEEHDGMQDVAEIDEEEDENSGSRKKKRKGKQSEDLQGEEYADDMYRMFEGSALMAMGMLVQEYLAKMLRVQAPIDWAEEAVESAEEDEEEEEEEELDAHMDVENDQPRLPSMLEGLIQMSERSSEGPILDFDPNEEVEKMEGEDEDTL